MRRVGKKLGDTLVEVTIAIGIFSMVAVAVVSVVSSSTSGAQSALETTVAREEIDAQAEALRFIQNANLKDVWSAIEKRAVSASGDNLSYNPSTCAELYQNNGAIISDQKAFIINTRALRSGDANSIIESYSNDVFKPAETYPKIVYQKDGNTLYDQNTSSSIKKVEGLYIVAIKNTNNTNIVDGTGGKVEKTSAFYDFYIRSCWYSANSTAPTTISTVVRLYNPNVAVDGGSTSIETYGDIITFERNGNSDIDKKEDDTSYTPEELKSQWNAMNNEPHGEHEYGQKINSGSMDGEAYLKRNGYESYYYEFAFWCDVKPKSPTSTNCDNGGRKYKDGDKYTTPSAYTSNKKITLYATWKKRNLVKVGVNGNSGTCSNWKQQIPATMSAKLQVSSFKCSRSHYDLVGLTAKSDGTGTVYKQNDSFKVGTSDVTLYAKWKEKSYNSISYSCGDGKAKTTNLTQKVYSDDGTVNLKKVSTLCTAPSNKSFVRWNVSNCSALPSSYTDGASYTYNSSCTKGVNLTAEWKSNNQTLIKDENIGNDDFTYSLPFNKSTFTKLTATGTATISYKSCHSSTTGWATGSVDMVVTYKGDDGKTHTSEKKTLVSHSFNTTDWVEGTAKKEFNETVSLPNSGTDFKVEFQDNSNGIFCYRNWGDWKYHYHKSIDGLKIVLSG